MLDSEGALEKGCMQQKHVLALGNEWMQMHITKY